MIGEDNVAPDSIAPASTRQFKNVDVVRSIYKFEGENKDLILEFNQGEVIQVLSKGLNGWWDGVIEKPNGELLRGWFPASYVRSVTQAPSFSKLLKSNLAESSYSSQHSSGPSSRRNSGLSMDSSLNEADRTSVTTSNLIPDTAVDREVNILSSEEVNSLCERVLNHTNEPPIWIPQLTDEGELIYYNESFNVYSRQLPLTSTPIIDPDSIFNFPHKTTLNNLDTVNVRKDDDAQEKLNYRQDPKSNSSFDHNPSTPQHQHQQHQEDQSSVAGKSTRESIKCSQQSISSETVHNVNTALFSTDELFYTDPSDMKTWVQLYKTFVFLLDLCLDSLVKNQTSVFSTHYNNITKVCTLFQLSARLVQHQLMSQNLNYLIQSKLKKMTNSVAQLGINGDLCLAQHPSNDYPYDDSESVSSDTPATVDFYLRKVRADIKSLKRRAEACYKIFISIKYDDPDHDPSLLPQIYPRFMKEVFDGGNWSNPLFEKKQNPFKYQNTASSQFGSKRTKRFMEKSNRSRILLDKDAMSTLEGKKAKLTKILADLLETLDRSSPDGMDVAKFKEERNVAVLSEVYNILQPASRIMDILESFDFNVFKAVKQMPMTKEGQGDDETSAFISQEIVSYTYPMLIEFFEFKQELYDSFAQLFMDAQGLTLEDPEVFKGIREDDLIDYNKAASELPTEKLAAKLKTLLIENDINNTTWARLQFKKDDKLRESIEKLGKSLGMVMYSTQQLINERESILNYSSRNMNIEFDINLFMGERHTTMPDLIEEFHEDEAAYPRKMSKDLPWFLDIDDVEYSIVYDSKGNIKGGSIDGLVAYLTTNAEKDQEFVNAFLLTFRSFISPMNLVLKLEERYNITPPEGLSFEEYNTWIEKRLMVVRGNIISIIWLLLTRYWNFYYFEESLMAQLTSFIDSASDQVISSKQQFHEQIKVLRDLSRRKTAHSIGSNFKIESIPVTNIPPAPILKGSSLRRLKLRDIDPLEMARQLTLREFAFYSKITEAEFLDKVWGEKYGKMGSSANIKFFISYANQLTNFVSFMIIKHKDPKKRADTVVYFLQVCEKCLALKNYSSLTAVISALSSSPIARLKKTWAKVPSNYLETYNRLDKLMSIDRNYNEYRDLLKFVKSNEPCIPFLGIYLTDLTFVSQAISDFVDRKKDVINFYKRYKIYHTVTESLKYERVPYNLQIVHEIQSFLDNWFLVSPDVNDQHKISLALEPRVVPSVR